MPILSIVIPTHERFYYAKQTVETILAMPGDIEIIICDTSEINNWLNYSNHPNLKIIRPSANISVVDNFNIALSHSTGDYVCFIGDDDLISREIIQISQHALKLGVDAIRFTFPIVFYWQDFKHRSNPEAYSGTIWTSKYSAIIKSLNTHDTIKDAASKLGHGVFDMPRAYCGLLSRELIKSIIAKHGNLFGGVSPDIYSATLVAAHANKAIEIDFPAVIPGSSGASTAGHSAAGKHKGNLRDNAHIRPFKNLQWHPLVPEFYSVPTVWGYSIIRALEKISPNITAYPHWGRLYIQCIIYHRDYFKFTKIAMKNFINEKSTFALIRTLFSGLIMESGWALKRIWLRYTVRFKVNHARRIEGVTGSASADSIIEKIIVNGPKPCWLKP